VTRGQLPQRAGSLGLTAVGLPPRYPLSTVQYWEQVTIISCQLNHSQQYNAAWHPLWVGAMSISYMCGVNRHTTWSTSTVYANLWWKRVCGRQKQSSVLLWLRKDVTYINHLPLNLTDQKHQTKMPDSTRLEQRKYTGPEA